MPTYAVTTSANRFDDATKARIAREITRIHHEVTGAPGFFAQVNFHELPPGNTYIGGAKCGGDQIYIHGQIRDGRTAEQKTRLINEILDAVVECAETPRFNVWVYIVDLVPGQMAEFGHVLPQSGKEREWMDNLPSADREKMLSIAK